MLKKCWACAYSGVSRSVEVNRGYSLPVFGDGHCSDAILTAAKSEAKSGIRLAEREARCHSQCFGYLISPVLDN